MTVYLNLTFTVYILYHICKINFLFMSQFDRISTPTFVFKDLNNIKLLIIKSTIMTSKFFALFKICNENHKTTYLKKNLLVFSKFVNQ